MKKVEIIKNTLIELIKKKDELSWTQIEQIIEKHQPLVLEHCADICISILPNLFQDDANKKKKLICLIDKQLKKTKNLENIKLFYEVNYSVLLKIFEINDDVLIHFHNFYAEEKYFPNEKKSFIVKALCKKIIEIYENVDPEERTSKQWIELAVGYENGWDNDECLPSHEKMENLYDTVLKRKDKKLITDFILLYLIGKKVARNMDKIGELAIAGENLDTIFMLAKAYASGSEVERNYEKAFFFSKLAYDKGSRDLNLICNLGIFYADGLGVKQDISEGIKYYEQASSQGYIMATRFLAALYRSFGSDYYQQSFQYYKKAADLGGDDAEPYIDLAVLYLNGYGCKQSIKNAQKFCKIAIEKATNHPQFLARTYGVLAICADFLEQYEVVHQYTLLMLQQNAFDEKAILNTVLSYWITALSQLNDPKLLKIAEETISKLPFKFGRKFSAQLSLLERLLSESEEESKEEKSDDSIDVKEDIKKITKEIVGKNAFSLFNSTDKKNKIEKNFYSKITKIEDIDITKYHLCFPIHGTLETEFQTKTFGCLLLDQEELGDLFEAVKKHIEMGLKAKGRNKLGIIVLTKNEQIIMDEKNYTHKVKIFGDERPYGYTEKVEFGTEKCAIILFDKVLNHKGKILVRKKENENQSKGFALIRPIEGTKQFEIILIEPVLMKKNSNYINKKN